MAQRRWNNQKGEVYLIVLGVAVILSVAYCLVIHQAFKTIIEALP